MSQTDLREMRVRRVKRVLLRVTVAIVQAILAGISVWALYEVLK